jgi:hypothetical protein
VTVYVPDSELSLLALPQVPGVLRQFLVALSHSQSCKAIAINVLCCSFIQRRISTIARQRAHAGVGGKEEKQMVALMKTVTRVTLSSALFEREGLLKVGQMLLKGLSVVDCHLIFHSRLNVSKILSRTSFPALQYLRVSSPFPVNLSVPFLHQHENLRVVGLFGTDA